MEIIRNMFRRKFRTSLTVLGIVIGIFAFSVMGAMSEKMNLMIDGGIRFVSGQIIVGAKGGAMGNPLSGSLLDNDLIRKIKNVEGVKATQKRVVMTMEESSGQIQLGMPKIVEGWQLGTGFKLAKNIDVQINEGRQIKKNDSKTAVVGSDIAREKDIELGDFIKIRGAKFKVVGITKKMMTGPDQIVFIPLKDARRLFVDSQPFLKNLKNFELANANNALGVSWKRGVDPEKLAKKIENEVDGVYALSPTESAKSFKNASVVINMIIMGSALIAVIVGGLSVINTMVISVNERTREIGLKRAVGAKTRNILADYLLEASLIGLIGGLIGLGLAVTIVEVVNNQTLEEGIEIFAVTPRLAMAALAFSLILGILAGIYPAIHASRLNPVKALRAE